MPDLEWAHGADGREWALDAACGKGIGPGPDDFHAKSRAKREATARFCVSHCAVRLQCLEDAMRIEAVCGSRFGVYGGYTAAGRDELARQRQRMAAVLESTDGVR
ncbi:WhiB family transcriptional regulator [Streptomyces cylindrosporus]|uniref:WhiB family transcriptional regulator n=1 Tax=Streptomyces cylindrosporus TaxID=2927583 RepID=A0ABS9YK62_9ACTN|nr:WhiB family transcriptional regulator [Streptomyces cylindrosporus]MCI3277569.1 WhiB family transcriptional regulator [Streptomyces cylindrosporus]